MHFWTRNLSCFINIPEIRVSSAHVQTRGNQRRETNECHPECGLSLLCLPNTIPSNSDAFWVLKREIVLQTLFGCWLDGFCLAQNRGSTQNFPNREISRRFASQRPLGHQRVLNTLQGWITYGCKACARCTPCSHDEQCPGDARPYKDVP